MTSNFGRCVHSRQELRPATSSRLPVRPHRTGRLAVPAEFRALHCRFATEIGGWTEGLLSTAMGVLITKIGEVARMITKFWSDARPIYKSGETSPVSRRFSKS
jgi:hypothetical protein